MKPSTRIEEIRQEMLKEKPLKDVYGETYILSAILDYLDEEYEKEKIRKEDKDWEEYKKDL